MLGNFLCVCCRLLTFSKNTFRNTSLSSCQTVLIVAFVFNVPPTAKVIWKRGHSFKSHPTDWWSRESNLRPLVYKASGLSTTPQRLLKLFWSRSGPKFCQFWSASKRFAKVISRRQKLPPARKRLWFILTWSWSLSNEIKQMYNRIY